MYLCKLARDCSQSTSVSVVVVVLCTYVEYPFAEPVRYNLHKQDYKQNMLKYAISP